MSHLLFPLISPENLVKVGRCDGNGELVSLPAAEIPHCFHSCLARNMAEGWGKVCVCGGGADAINSCVKMRYEKQKG